MDNKISILSRHLEQEINWIESLNCLLAEEKEILSSRQFNKLEEFANKKQDLSNKLEESAKQRIQLINPNSNQPMNQALTEFLKDCSAGEAAQINQLNTKLAENLTRCRELNSINGQIIANNLYVRQEIVNTLSGNRENAIGVYTSNGNIESTPETTHHQEA
ncbi:flagellar protein FlgN [Fluoribacter dumoffii]|uniref:FlgN protein n=1 Tax=Fluoribacter dumoffii TaxID=463 RepID=A0A377G853_9GAMM|nr:flagellar protein FlgN [Fluoribacter dumoffii]KTC89697.1 flagellar biosynthesis/type III secretory pathway chaperone [Fluoribacter dumoffii NY 23]MCW8384891.1 flagellar protein FlgN [Fluoribacter dumoffii]MCW8417953.1 flagellar protein FlgN [Fluoribacter dumoffii]MCW8454205.1 flagellar protein FlgN [Fluoribacter dumoffii]MCW8461721.1 flagellar protein FlgN [Fluoribacter dumoffii]